MKFLKNTEGVSEVVGAMFVLLILVVYLGIMQGYEVPKWNKELEKQAFDLIYKDFIDLRSDLEDSSIKNMPITSSMHTGARYPERFMLQNPGQGAYGAITTYPLEINVSYNSNGTVHNENYSSLGFVYEMKGISDFPKLVYEHGMVINDFGNWNNSDDVNHLATENGIFIPFLRGIEPVYSAEVETFNILPVTRYNFTEAISTMNVTLETRYPDIWTSMPPESIPPGSQYIVENGKIKITGISGFDIRNLSLPVISTLSGNNIHSGIIRFMDSNTVINTISINMTRNITNTITNNLTNTSITNITNNITNTAITNITNTMTTNITNNITNSISVFSVSSNCSNLGFYVWDASQGCLNLPPSASIQKFIVQDIRFGGSIINKDIVFDVQDVRNNQFKVQMHFDSDSNGNPTSMGYSQIYPASGCSPTPQLINGEINLTLCYRNANVISPNVMKINTVEPGVLFAKFLIY